MPNSYVYRVEYYDDSGTLKRFKLLDSANERENTLLVGVFDLATVVANSSFDSLKWESRDERWPNSQDYHWSIRRFGNEWEDVKFGSIYQSERAIRAHVFFRASANRHTYSDSWYEEFSETCDELLRRLGHRSRRENLAILGVTLDSPSDIKAAYRRLATIHHPDHGGDARKFREIQKAYSTLINQ